MGEWLMKGSCVLMYYRYGYTWTLTLTTLTENISPTSPTHNQTRIYGKTSQMKVRSTLEQVPLLLQREHCP
jgi:hypothetical protein